MRYLIFIFLFATASAVSLCETSFEDYFEYEVLSSNYFDVAQDGDNVYICGLHGNVLTTKDKGESWKRADIQTSAFFNSIAVKGKTIIAVGAYDIGVVSNAAIVYSTDGGENWNESDFEDQRMLNDVVMFDSNTGVAFGGSGIIIKTSDGGKSWNVIESDVYFNYIIEGVVTESGKLFVVSSTEGLFCSTDRGETWLREEIEIDEQYFNSTDLTYSLDKSLYLMTENYIFKSTDEGENWARFSKPDVNFEDYTHCSYSKNGKGMFYGGDSLNVFIVENDTNIVDVKNLAVETTLHNLNFVNTNLINNIVYIDAKTALAVGTNNIILKTTDGGEKWETLSYLSDLFTGRLGSVHFINDSIGYVGVGSDYESLYKTTDGGITWNIQERQEEGKVTSQVGRIYFWNENKGVIQSSDQLLKTTDGGKTFFEKEEIDLNGASPTMYVASGDTLFFKGNRWFWNNYHGYYVFKSFNGDTWNYRELDSVKIMNVYFKNNSDIFMTASYLDSSLLPVKPDLFYRGLLLHSTDGGGSWNRRYFKNYDVLTNIYFFNESDGILFANGKGASIFRTSDGGRSWFLTDSAIAKSLGGIISFDQKRVLAFAGGIKALFSQDSGYTWEAINFIENFGVSGISKTTDYTYLSGRLGKINPAILRLKLKNETSVEEREKTEGLKAPLAWIYEPYPNPAKKFVNFKIVWDKRYGLDELKVRIYDIFGREIKNPNVNFESESINKAVLKWNTEGVGDGLYIIQLKVGDYSKSRKVILY